MQPNKGKLLQKQPTKFQKLSSFVTQEIGELKDKANLHHYIINAILETVAFPNKVFDGGTVIHDGDIKIVWIDTEGVWQQIKPAKEVTPVNPEQDGN